MRPFDDSTGAAGDVGNRAALRDRSARLARLVALLFTAAGPVLAQVPGPGPAAEQAARSAASDRLAPLALPPARSLHGQPGITGNVRLHDGVRSRFLDHARGVWVYLPPGYEDEPTCRYPILYVHDGNNVFDPATAFLGREWTLDETLERLIDAGRLPPLVVVAVGNSPARISEYTWHPGTVEGRTTGGDGSRYGRFLVEELKPAVDRSYRTLPGPRTTAVMGSSLGGLISLYLAVHHPGTFGRIAAVSPSVWWSERRVVSDLSALPSGLRIWIDIGWHEGEPVPPGATPRAVEDLRRLRTALVARRYHPGAGLGYFEDPDGHHDEPSWSRRSPRILRFLFPAPGSR